MGKHLQGRGGADARPPASVPAASQAPCWVLDTHGSHDNLLGSWRGPVLQMGTRRLRGQVTGPGSVRLKFELLGLRTLGKVSRSRGAGETGYLRPWASGATRDPGVL